MKKPWHQAIGRPLGSNCSKDILHNRFSDTFALEKARKLLEADDQSEEAFLGAQGVLLLQGLL